VADSGFFVEKSKERVALPPSGRRYSAEIFSTTRSAYGSAAVAAIG
jgi:hypothetical protein